jgi:hypothetical protein
MSGVITRIQSIEDESTIPLTTQKPKCLTIRAETTAGSQELLISEEAARELSERLSERFRGSEPEPYF